MNLDGDQRRQGYPTEILWAHGGESRVPQEAQPTRQGGETLQQTYDTIANKFEKMIDLLPRLKSCFLPTNRVVVEIDDFGQNLDIYGRNTHMDRFWRSWLPVFSTPRLPRSPPDSLLTSIF